MVKVLNIISDTNIGGAGMVLLNYLKFRDASRYDVSVVLPTGSMLKEKIEELGVPIYEIDAMHDRSFDPSAVFPLVSLIKKIAPDIVHTHGSMSGRIAAKLCRRKTIFTRHCAFPVKYTSGIKYRISRFLNVSLTDRVIAVGPAVLQNLLEMGIPESMIDTMMNGVEPVEKLTPEQALNERSRLGVGADEFVIGILARIEEYKGHMYILDAVDILKKQGRKLKLLIGGAGSYEDRVRRRTEELGLEDSVVFTGFVSRISDFLGVLDVQINASDVTETSSLSLLEGMSIGLPAIASDCSGNPWIIKDGVNGLLFENRSPEALAACIARLMDDPGLLKAMSDESYKIYESAFTGVRFAENVEKTYQKTLEAKSYGR